MSQLRGALTHHIQQLSSGLLHAGEEGGGGGEGRGMNGREGDGKGKRNGEMKHSVSIHVCNTNMYIRICTCM